MAGQKYKQGYFYQLDTVESERGIGSILRIKKNADF